MVLQDEALGEKDEAARCLDMKGLGTVINIICILLGGTVGCLAGNRLKDNIRETLMTMNGVGVVIIGVSGAMVQMLSVEDGRMTSNGTIMMVVSLAVGAVVGELLQLERQVARFGEWLKAKSHSEGDNTFVSGFVATSCTVCIGAMAVIGAVQDGISGDYSILAAKGILDAIIVCIMAASQGKGCVFSAIPVGIVQGAITLFAVFAGDFFPEAALGNLSLVGSVLILCVGLNLIRDRQIRVANALPAIVVAIAWGFWE